MVRSSIETDLRFQRNLYVYIYFFFRFLFERRLNKVVGKSNSYIYCFMNVKLMKFLRVTAFFLSYYCCSASVYAFVLFCCFLFFVCIWGFLYHHFFSEGSRRIVCGVDLSRLTISCIKIPQISLFLSFIQ